MNKMGRTILPDFKGYYDLQQLRLCGIDGDTHKSMRQEREPRNRRAQIRPSDF